MRKTTAALLAAVGLVASPIVDHADAATVMRCPGKVTIVSQSNIEFRVRRELTITEFDYTALHTLCLPDGVVVDDAHQAGHLTIRQRTDGSGTVSFISTVTYGDGSLIGIGDGRISDDGVISGRVVVPGGTGTFAGTTGHGWFRSTDGVTFENEAWYRFP
jgi:hypothetical protein